MTETIKTCTEVRPERSIVELAAVAVEETVENAARLILPDGFSQIGITSRDDSMGLAILTGRKWNQNRILTVSFKAVGQPGGASSQAVIDETAKRFKLVDDQVNIGIKYITDWHAADIRVAFFRGQGSWSYLGTDATTISRDRPTMNFGWLNDGAEDEEFDRVAPHEFMHALGCPHEHQHPEAGIKWNEERVYAYYAGPPNNWSREQTRHNLFERYDRTITQYTAFDPESIMAYPIPKEFTLDGFSIGWNRKLSPTDIAGLRMAYPPKEEPTEPTKPYRPDLPRNTVDKFDRVRGDLFDLEQVFRGRRKRGAPIEELGRFVPKAKDA